MQRTWFILLALFATVLDAQTEASLFMFEGVFGTPVKNIRNMNANATMFLPYNPVIVEVGAYEGEGTQNLAQTFPYGKIFAFEPHPKAYSLLAENMQFFKNVLAINLAVNTFNGTANLWRDGPSASLLHLRNQEPKIDIPCVVLDDWCKHHGITHIDFLRLDVGGLEWQILQSSPEILKTVLVIVTKTHMCPFSKFKQSRLSRGPILSYSMLKNFLENQGFTLLSHWYQEGREGEATFVRKRMYDSIFN
ncbi:MAG: FkbM family methyltransferase [Candidatus Rhabdochlamydia sp.]